jgi:transcriptional regulator with XRE-family HTH domain
MELAKKIKALRLERGWSQQRLADRARISQQGVSKIERGEVYETRKIARIAAAFGLTVDELIGQTQYHQYRDSDFPADLDQEEQELIAAYRAAPVSVKAAIRAALKAHIDSPPTRRRPYSTVVADRPVPVQKRARRVTR